METKDKIRVLFDTDADGYIIGYQQEFYDGKQWQAPFDTTNAVEVTPADLANICLGASKVSSDGTITTDAEKQKEIGDAEAKLEEEAKPVDYQAIIAQLKSEQSQTNGALLELSDMLLTATSTDTTTEETK